MALSSESVMSAVPHRNRAARFEEHADGTLVSVPRRRPWWLRGPVRMIIRISGERRIQFDAMGSFVLTRIDGRRTVEQLVECMMGRYQLSFAEARSSVATFLRMLMERGVIVIQVGKGASKSPSAARR